MRTTPHRVRQHSLHSIISVNRDRVYKATSFVELLHLTYAIYDQIDHHLLHGPLHHWSLSLFRKSSTLTISFLSFSISLSLSLSHVLSLSFSLSLTLSYSPSNVRPPHLPVLEYVLSHGPHRSSRRARSVKLETSRHFCYESPADLILWITSSS